MLNKLDLGLINMGNEQEVIDCSSGTVQLCGYYGYYFKYLVVHVTQ